MICELDHIDTRFPSNTSSRRIGGEMKSQRWDPGVSVVMLILALASNVWPQQGKQTKRFKR